MNAYQGPWWLPNGHFHTIYAAVLGRFMPRPRFRRERWETPDGDFVDVDFGDGPGSSPLLVLFHGLEGSSASHYAIALAQMTRALGWRFVLPHFRGCSGEMNRLPRAYHSGDSQEIAWLLQKCKVLAGDQAVFSAGVSLGGNALLKWLGEAGSEAAGWVSAAAAVSAPLDLRVCGDALGLGFNRVYTRMFLRTMKAKAADKLSRHGGLFDAGAMRRARTLREFDDVVTAPLHGFAGTDDYWRRASAKPLLERIRVPTLIVSALDDPFVPPAALPSERLLPPCVRTEFPVAGGHVGFVSGTFPGTLEWLPQRVLAHFGQYAAVPSAH